jgi:trk system potassium uptake protein
MIFVCVLNRRQISRAGIFFARTFESTSTTSHQTTNPSPPQMIRNDADVLAIDGNPEIINEIADSVTCAMSLDVCDMDALREAGISNMDAVVVAMADSLDSSIMCVMSAKELGVPKVIAKAKDEMMEKILKRVGADQVVFPEKESGIRLSHKLISEHLVDYFDLSDSTSLVEILPRAEWVGKNLRELNLRKEYKINVVAVIQNDEFNIAMDPDTPLKADEPLLIIMKKSDLKRFER